MPDRIWPATDGPAVSTVDPTQYCLGVEFSLSEASEIAAFYWWVASDQDTGPVSCRLYEITAVNLGDVVPDTDATSDILTQGEWNRIALPAPVTLEAVTPYRAVVLTSANGNRYSSTGAYWSTGAGGSGITNGILNAPNAAGTAFGSGDQGSFFASAAMVFPSEQFNATNYWVDVEIGVDASSPSRRRSSFGHVRRMRGY